MCGTTKITWQEDEILKEIIQLESRKHQLGTGGAARSMSTDICAPAVVGQAQELAEVEETENVTLF